MGSCATSRKSISIIGKTTLNIQFFITQKVKVLIRNNPFNNITFTDFNQQLISFINTLQNTSNVENDTIINFLKCFKLKELDEKMFIDIIKLSLNKLSLIIPKNNLFTVICYMLYFVLCRESNENKLERKKFLLNLFKNSNNQKASFSLSKISFLIMNILIFISFIFLYYCLGPAILEVHFNFNNENIKSIYIDKITCKSIKPNSFNKKIYSKIKEMNHNFDRIKFIETSLKYIFQPLKNYYDLNNSTSSLVEPKDNEIDEIIKRLDYFFVCENLLEVFLKMKIKEY